MPIDFYYCSEMWRKKNNEFNIFIAEHKNYHDFKKYCSGRSSKTKYSLNSWNMTEAIFKTKIIPFWFIIPFLSQERNSIKSWFKKTNTVDERQLRSCKKIRHWIYAYVFLLFRKLHQMKFLLAFSYFVVFLKKT